MGKYLTWSWPIIWLNIYIKLIWYSLVKWSGKLWSHGTWRTEEMSGPYPNQWYCNKWAGDRSRDQAFLWCLACSERWADHRQFVHNILYVTFLFLLTSNSQTQFTKASYTQPSFPSQILFACVHNIIWCVFPWQGKFWLNCTQANETWQKNFTREIWSCYGA